MLWIWQLMDTVFGRSDSRIGISLSISLKSCTRKVSHKSKVLYWGSAPDPEVYRIGFAKELGVTDGINNTDFAPNQKVTFNQLATFVLRTVGESNFDYMQGIELLINKGIITSEKSETMDLFTRGDMTKIVYEAKLMY